MRFMLITLALVACSPGAPGVVEITDTTATAEFIPEPETDADADSDSDADADGDADTDSDPTTIGSPTVDDDDDGFTENGGDCDDSNSEQFPGNPETACNNVNDDCDDDTRDNADADGDGFGLCDNDCDDNESTVNPGVFDSVDGNSIDANCDGIDGVDADLDGVPSTGSGGEDCDDTDIDTYAGAPESCDGADNDCNSAVDDKDADGDGFVDAACSAYDGGLPATDCDDNAEEVVPNGLETNGNGIDDNCNSVVDGFSLTMVWDAPGTNQASLDWTLSDLPLDQVYLGDEIKVGITDGSEHSLMGCILDGSSDCGNVLDYDPSQAEGLGFNGPAPGLTYLVSVGDLCRVWGPDPSYWEGFGWTGCGSVTFSGNVVNL